MYRWQWAVFKLLYPLLRSQYGELHCLRFQDHWGSSSLPTLSVHINLHSHKNSFQSLCMRKALHTESSRKIFKNHYSQRFTKSRNPLTVHLDNNYWACLFLCVNNCTQFFVNFPTVNFPTVNLHNSLFFLNSVNFTVSIVVQPSSQPNFRLPSQSPSPTPSHHTVGFYLFFSFLIFLFYARIF